MKRTTASPKHLLGTLAPPGDKSISHRSAILNALAKGEASVSNYSPGADCAATLRCLRAIGVPIHRLAEEGSFVIEGLGLYGFREPTDVLNAGNSATTMRLLAGLLAGQTFFSVITGDSSLRSRPMNRIIEPLIRMGAHVQGRDNNTKAPFAINGGDLTGIDYTMSVASAQLKSCLMIAGLFASGNTILHQPAKSRDHTERMLQRMGVAIVEEGLTVTLKPGQRIQSLDIHVPTDISSAAYWLVAAVCHPSAQITVKRVGINHTRAGVIEALRDMGAKIALSNRRLDGGEEVADVTAESSDLTGTEVTGSLVPRLVDEIPVLALAACFARGTTTIRDAGELRIKETDRVRTTVMELSRFGADIQELPDGMVIRGTGGLKGCVGSSHGDHRLAMTLGIAGILANGETDVRGAEAARVSYPAFWDDLYQLVGDR